MAMARFFKEKFSKKEKGTAIKILFLVADFYIKSNSPITAIDFYAEIPPNINPPRSVQNNA